MFDFTHAFKLQKVDYSGRKECLGVSSAGVVKSDKFFPVYDLDGVLHVFKPLSRTKPMTTGAFAAAEVFWSNVLNEYFCRMPIYRPAVCRGYAEAVPKYYEYGTLVPYVAGEGEKMVNLLEYFTEHPDPAVDIGGYVNFCMKAYDYTAFYDTGLFADRPDLGRNLSMQVLCSILGGDQNFHYENVVFICSPDGSVLRMAPMLDHEFSAQFLFPDDLGQNRSLTEMICRYLSGTETEHDNFAHGLRTYGTMAGNMRCIMERFPEVVSEFVHGIDRMCEDMRLVRKDRIAELVDALRGTGLFFPCSSDAYNIGISRYKKQDEQEAKVMEMLCPAMDLESLLPGFVVQAVDGIIDIAYCMKDYLLNS